MMYRIPPHGVTEVNLIETKKPVKRQDRPSFKKNRHFSRPTSNSNNSGTMSRNHLKFGVRRVPIGDPSHTQFQVNRKNGSRVIAVWSRTKRVRFFYSPCNLIPWLSKNLPIWRSLWIWINPQCCNTITINNPSCLSLPMTIRQTVSNSSDNLANMFTVCRIFFCVCRIVLFVMETLVCK